MLSAHEHVAAIPEETQAFCRPAYDGEPASFPFETEALMRRLERLPMRASHRRWAEKTPKNVHYFGRILEHFHGRVRLIHLVRDARDVVTSYHPKDATRYWVTKERWISDVEAGLLWEGHPRVLTIRYEDLVAQYESTMRRVCGFLEEPYSPRIADWNRYATVRKNVAWSGPIAPLSSARIGKWATPEHERVVRALLDDERALRLMRHFGYLV